MYRKAIQPIGMCLMLALSLPSVTQAATVEELEQQLKAQQQLIEQLQRQVQQVQQNQGQPPAQASDGSYPQEGSSLPEQAQELSERETLPGWGGIYSKPVLRRGERQVYVGGYFDLEFIDPQEGNARFDQHRLVPFLYADVSDRIKFATEIEIEHGGPDSPGGGEVKVEFATVDYQLAEAANLRAGIILSPLGKFNLVHDAPLQDLTARSLLHRSVIPTTLSEAGAGIYGSVYPTDVAKLDYEAYIVNGFNGTTASAVNISRTSGFRNAKGSTSGDNNDNPAFVGRVALSPFLGLETGISTHIGDYDEVGENMLAITALDATWQHGPFEVLAEGAYASISRDAYTKARGVPDDMYGYSVQGNYHFMPEFLKDWAPAVFREESTFTLVNHWGWVNLDGNRSSRYAVGLNFRPIEEAVLKSEFQFNQESGRLDSVDDNQLLFSVASYF